MLMGNWEFANRLSGLSIHNEVQLITESTYRTSNKWNMTNVKMLFVLRTNWDENVSRSNSVMCGWKTRFWMIQILAKLALTLRQVLYVSRSCIGRFTRHTRKDIELVYIFYFPIISMTINFTDANHDRNNCFILYVERFVPSGKVKSLFLRMNSWQSDIF